MNNLHFVVNGSDYFSALTIDGKVRIGNVGGISYDLSPTHDLYGTAIAAADESQVESIVDIMAAQFPEHKNI